MGTVFAREKMRILLNKSQSRTGEKKHTGTQKYNMETISQLGSVIKLTVLFNLMPAITGLCSSVFLLEFVASNFCNGGIRKKKQFVFHSVHAAFLFSVTEKLKSFRSNMARCSAASKETS